MKNRWNFRGASCEAASPFLEFGLPCCAETVTTRLPSLRILSFERVRTGDHSMSSWEGAGSSVINRVVCGLSCVDCGCGIEVGIVPF